MEFTQRKHDLTEGVIWKKVISFALPILFGILLQSLYTTADAVIIGQFAGKEALAAIDSVHTLIKLPFNFFIGLSSGATIIISQYFGAKKTECVSDASHTALLFAFVGGILLSIIGCSLAPFAVQLIQVPSDIHDNALIYTMISLSGMAASMIYNIGAGIFRALGNSKTPFYYSVIANFVNIGLDLLIVGVLHWGVIGSAVTTVFAQILSATLVFIAFTKTDLACKIYPEKLRFHKLHLNEFFKLGLPVGIQSMLFPISNTIVQTSINTFGVNSIAAWAICGKLDFLIWYISDAFAISISTFVAQNFGANQLERAKKGTRTGLLFALLSIMIVSLGLYLGSASLGRLLVDDEEVIALVSQILLFLAPLYILYVPVDIFPGAIRGTGESIKPMVITLLCTCVCRILWIFLIVPLHPTLMTVLCCYPVSWALTSFVFFVYYLLHNKKINQQFA